MNLTRQFVLCLIVSLALLSTVVEAFAPTPWPVSRSTTTTSASSLTRKTGSHSSSSSSSTQREAFLPSSSSSLEVAASTFDPAAALSDVLGGFLGSPAVLAVPILAALSVAGLVAFFIVSYANPEVEDDEQ
jgi:hypothetical protein